jgi:MoaA/NifB/PqqE/SkfB family radical SAM enzyme
MDQSDLSFEDFEKCLDTFPEVKHIELQGEGESLLHQRFFDMARLARERGIRVSVITNGSFLTPEYVAQILDVGIISVAVSIESPDPLVFKQIRGGRLEKVIEGIKRLLAMRTERGLAFPTVGFAVTILKRTVDSLPEIADLHDRLGMDGGIGAQVLNAMACYTKVYDEDMAGQHLDEETQARLDVYMSQNPQIRRLLELADTVKHFYAELGKSFPSSHGCPWVKGGLYVHRHGEVTSCCMIKETSKYALGKIGETPLEAMLEARRGLDRMLSAGDVPAQCEGCGYLTPDDSRPGKIQLREV